MVAPHGELIYRFFCTRWFYTHGVFGACRNGPRAAHGAGQRCVALMPILYTLGVKHVFTRSLVSFSLGEWGPANGTRH